MCGISGYSGRFPQELLAAMNHALIHRGPDDHGEYRDRQKGIGLAHRRLSIIDLSDTGKQPMWDASGQAVIIFNGEIYNYKELRADLITDGHKFISQSDTEVVVNLYLRYGRDFLPKLNGIFTLAIWDPRSEILLLARDGVGVKPFYYSETSQGFLFASEIKALLQSSVVDRELDYTSIRNYLTFLWSPGRSCILKQVKKLLPGHALEVQNGSIGKTWQFYDLPYQNKIADFTESEAVERVEQGLRQAVERQMVADVPVGAFLSGGLDSSAIVYWAQKAIASKQKLECFTIGFQDDGFLREGMAEDLPYARRVAEHLGVNLHTIMVGPEMADSLPAMLYHLDEPLADPAPLNVMFICQLARKHGIKVLLSGAGGDDIFSGYRRHVALNLERYWQWIPQGLRSVMRKGTSLLPHKYPSTRRISKAMQYADLSGDMRLASYFMWTRPETSSMLFRKGLREELNTTSPCDPLLASLSNLSPDVPAINKMLYLEGKHFLPDHNLNYTDKMSMAMGVEVRVPLLDPDLISLATQLPVHFKQRGTVGKWIFKKAMEGHLPHDVIYRPKTGFGAPLRSWLRHELRPVVEDVLSEKTLKERGIFNPGNVRRLIEDDRKGYLDATYTLFSLMSIELWCRIFIDHPVPVKIS